jgi:hypothetical protein
VPPQRGVILMLARNYRTSSVRPSVKVHLAAVRRIAPLHGEHSPAPHAVDRVLAEIVRKCMNLALTASDEVNVVRAILRARIPGHEDHLHHIGNAHVIAAQHLDIPERRPPGLPPFIAMHETFAPARHSFIASGNRISGKTARHPLLAPDPADVLDTTHGRPTVVTPRQPRRAMSLWPHGANVAWE